MKMVVAVFPQDRESEFRQVMSMHGVHGYTEVGTVTGKGSTGKKFGTLAWPEKSTLIFAVVEDDAKNELVRAMKECQQRCYAAEGLWACVFAVEEMV